VCPSSSTNAALKPSRRAPEIAQLMGTDKSAHLPLRKKSVKLTNRSNTCGFYLCYAHIEHTRGMRVLANKDTIDFSA
jgi:predicted nucleic acid binding AN1-type Zn finger protein